MCTLLHNILGHYRSRACRCVLHKCSTLFQASPVFYNFSFFPPQSFLPLGELPAIFITLKNPRLQVLSIWKSKQFVVWEKVKDYTTSNSLRITNRQVCANHNAKRVSSWNVCFPPISLYETDIPSVYSRTRNCGIHAFFSEITHFFFPDQCATFPQ